MTWGSRQAEGHCLPCPAALTISVDAELLPELPFELGEGQGGLLSLSGLELDLSGVVETASKFLQQVKVVHWDHAAMEISELGLSPVPICLEPGIVNGLP